MRNTKYLVLLLASLVLLEIPAVEQTHETSKKALSRSLVDCPIRGKVWKKYWSNFQDLADKYSIEDPESIVRPGDVLIYPFVDTAEAKKEDIQLVHLGEEPEAYRAALEGARHAAIVYQRKDGSIAHLDSARMELWLEPEFRGATPYFILRAKPPKGTSQQQYEQKINRILQFLAESGVDYDSLMDDDMENGDKRKELEQFVENGCQLKKGENSPFPPQSCAELAKTTLILGKIEIPKGIRAGELLDKGLASIEAKDLETRLIKAEQAANDIVNLFRDVLERTIKDKESSLQAAMIIIDHNQAMLLPGAKNVDGAKLTNANRAKIRKQLEMLRKQTQLERDVIERSRREIAQLELARDLLVKAARIRAKGETASFIERKLSQPVLDKYIIRPIDLFKSAQKGYFDIVGFYPGHLPATCKAPEFVNELPPVNQK